MVPSAVAVSAPQSRYGASQNRPTVYVSGHSKTKQTFPLVGLTRLAVTYRRDGRLPHRASSAKDASVIEERDDGCDCSSRVV